MNISRENKSVQNDIIKIELTKEDYLVGFEKKLKKYSKELNIDGFRKGAVPVGIIKKKYGESILAEEINHLTDQAINNYVKENNIRLLGRPILTENQELLDIKPNEDKSYQLAFEIGYEPEYKINLDGKFSKFEIDITTEMIDKEIENVKKHFTKLEDSADPIAEEDTFYFKFDNGKALQGESFASTSELTEEGKTQFLGKAMGDKITGVASSLFNNDKIDVNRYILNIHEANEEKEAEAKESIEFELTNVKKKQTPETLSVEQITQITRDEAKTSMDDLRAALEHDIQKQYENLALNFLRNDVYEFVSENTKIELPVDFLKRWIVSEKENKMTTESVEKDFDGIEKSIKWDLITSKFATENSIKVDFNEVKDEFKARYIQYFSQSGYFPPEDQLEKFASEAMKESKNVQKTYEQLLDTKILDKMIEQIKTKTVKYSEDQFLEENKKRNEKMNKSDAHTHEDHVHDENCQHEH